MSADFSAWIDIAKSDASDCTPAEQQWIDEQVEQAFAEHFSSSIGFGVTTQK